MRGHVSLVGAGPGDPGLLTRTAIARLRAAELVLYDALIDERILRYARKAQRFYVGKRAGRHAMTQAGIQALMIRAARRGRRVVRLKGGDPFVFGRGGEEALALQQAGIPYDVVPGISSAIAAPASAGIPVTHRGLASGFLVVSGHEEAAFASVIPQLRPNGVTVVVLMGLACKNAILIVEFAKQLQDAGRNRADAAVEASRLRLRPILMTSLAFTFGVVPLMLSHGAGAEMRVSIGTAVFAGMLGVTFFGVFLTPVFYVVIRRLLEHKRPAAPPVAAPASLPTSP